MANIKTNMLFGDSIVPVEQAMVSVASSAVLYGLSVYSVCPLTRHEDAWLAFRLADHIARLEQSARMIGLTGATSVLDRKKLSSQLSELIAANNPTQDQFCRISIHATELLPGIKTADLALTLSAFLYDAKLILPTENVRLKTSLWRRTTDTAIPARAKVNGAYVNSALAKQDALDAGCDDCLFLNHNGSVSELSAANIFMVKRGTLITPDCASDILEGITRRSIIDLATLAGIPVVERKVALTELYTADEVFACGTSAAIAGIGEIDNRVIGNGSNPPITNDLRTRLEPIYRDAEHDWTTVL